MDSIVRFDPLVGGFSNYPPARHQFVARWTSALFCPRKLASYSQAAEFRLTGEHTMSGPSASKLLVVGIAAALVFAPEAATAAPKYKNCYMARFRPPMRVCDDPIPYKKPKPFKEQVLVPIPSTGPSPFGPATRSRTAPSYRWRLRPSSPPDYRRSRAWPDRGQANQSR